ncbi:MAG: hypothetical protein KIT84_32245 [Labilithrix sp.]|nr:hypothetical protein [Labilithrix sp.]MCW5815744.1 hypothetical protein [Labilithrix sp.]
MRLSLALLVAASLVACRAADEGAAAGSQAVVEIAPDAVKVMNDVWATRDFDYLPWAYSPDGCFARSYFMSMELASRGIPVRQQIINLRWNSDVASNQAEFEPVDRAGNPVTYPATGGRAVKWQYHIAAVLMPGPNVRIAEPMVIDRALEPGPVTVEQWVRDANSSNIPVAPPSDAPLTTDDNGHPTRGFNQLKTRGAPYVGVGSFLNDNWASYEAEPELVPSFDPSTIQLACDTVWTIWVDCMGADEAATTKMLDARTNALVRDLDARHALTEERPAEPIACTRNPRFSCFAHSNAMDAEPADATE